MAIFRSPNYPAQGLREAYQRTRSLWAKERRTAVPSDVAARAMGYNGLSGPSRTALAAMKKYGLIQNDGSNVKVSERAIELIHSTADDDSLKIMRELALKPELFSYLYANYRHASDDAIRSYLIAKLHFSDGGALQAIKAYRDTYSFARLDDPEYNPQVDSGESTMERTQNAEVTFTATAAQSAVASSLSTHPSSVTSQTFSWPLTPDVKAEVKITGGELKPEYFDALSKYLELARGFVTTFEEGDTVEYPDAHTGEIKYGRIDRMYGSTAIIRTITKEEAGPNPKKFTPRTASGTSADKN